MHNILIISLGTSWAVVPEVYGLLNKDSFDLYKNSHRFESISVSRQKYRLEPVSEIWVITTSSIVNSKNFTFLHEWAAKHPEKPVIKYWYPNGVDELVDEKECHQMADLTHRIIAAAVNSDIYDKVYLSLAGGRKTMSADVQQAAHLFGCDALIHVASEQILPDNPLRLGEPELFLRPFEKKIASLINPLVCLGKLSPAKIAGLIDKIPEIPIQGEVQDSDFYNKVRVTVENSRNLLNNFQTELLSAKQSTNFKALYSLSPVDIKKLKEEKIAFDQLLKVKDLNWLQKLPKAELHCHFGGILSPAEMIRVAGFLKTEINEIWQKNQTFKDWCDNIQNLVNQSDTATIRETVPEVKKLRTLFAEIPEPFTVAAFLIAFERQISLLEEFIYGDYKDEKQFYRVGIDKYETLGDLQGSGLLQHEKTIRAAAKVLSEQTSRDNITYLELRCSPCNYTRGGLSAKAVVDIIRNELIKDVDCRYKILFIASRHGKMSGVYQHVELTSELAEDVNFFEWFAGFDLAGAESAKKPSELREAFLPLLEKCINITIHAGEDKEVENIWEAVYHLNADRIGHSLSLNENPKLLQRMIDRKIALELCPSSNFQIVGYKDYLLKKGDKVYPLKNFLDEGLRVTVNTDNAGISRTNLSHELYKAAAMTDGGLSKWDILLLIRNGFRSAFCSQAMRRNLLLQSERKILNLLNNS